MCCCWKNSRGILDPSETETVLSVRKHTVLGSEVIDLAPTLLEKSRSTFRIHKSTRKNPALGPTISRSFRFCFARLDMVQMYPNVARVRLRWLVKDESESIRESLVEHLANLVGSQAEPGGRTIQTLFPSYLLPINHGLYRCSSNDHLMGGFGWQGILR